MSTGIGIGIAGDTFQTRAGLASGGGGENIVTDGLIFRVDANDLASYPGTGTTWTDVINGNNGTILNGTAYNSAQGGYFQFDGVDDKVDFGKPAILESYPLSIDVWFYADTTGSKK